MSFLVAQFAAQDLADRRFGQRFAEFHVARQLVGGQQSAAVLDDVVAIQFRVLAHDQYLDRLAAALVGNADDGAFEDARVDISNPGRL